MAEENVQKDENELRKVYVVQISFDQPDSGPIQVLARDEKHALELTTKMLAHLKNLVIHDIIEQSKIEKAAPQDESPPTASEPSKVVH